MHALAAESFRANPSKCYQRHIREIYGKAEGNRQLRSLAGAEVRRISNSQAASVILKYEWLRTMAIGTRLSYGLFLEGELLGAVCFSLGAIGTADICRIDPSEPNEELMGRTLCLCRGACVPHAPKNAGSFLVRHACRLAYQEEGYCVFFAYSDPQAGEVGTIYQAVGWYPLPEQHGKFRWLWFEGKQKAALKAACRWALA